MKQQTFVTRLEDKQGRMINFERWSYKNINTVLKNVLELYSSNLWLYNTDIEKSESLAIYKTSNDEYIEKQRIGKDELLNLINKH